MKVKVRAAEFSDVKVITAIYNESVLGSTATFDLEPQNVEARMEWFERHGSKYPILVAEIDGIVIGWASLTPYSTRLAYSQTVENALYIFKSNHGAGIGNLLLKALLVEAKRNDFHTIIAKITNDNEASVHLHSKYGFKDVGVLKEVGRKFGRLLDVRLMQKILD